MHESSKRSSHDRVIAAAATRLQQGIPLTTGMVAALTGSVTSTTLRRLRRAGAEPVDVQGQRVLTWDRAEIAKAYPELGERTVEAAE